MRKLVTLPIIAFFFSLLVSAQTISSQDTQQAEDETQLTAKITTLYNEGKFDEALPLAKRLLTIREKGVEKDSLLMANVLNTIGAIFIAKGKYLDAEPFYQRSLKITEAKTSPDGIHVARILDKLALISYAKHDYGKTEEIYKRSLSIWEKLLGPTHPEVLNSLSRLADFYQLTEEYKKAEPLLQRIVAVRENATGSTHEGLSETLYQYSCLKRKMKRPDEADKLEARAYSLLDVAVGDIQKILLTDVGIVNGRALNLAKPSYPEEALRSRQTGEVYVRVLINEEGKVIRACAITGPSVFWRGTELAAYQSVFSPTTIGDKPVKVIGIVTYNFKAR